MSQPSLPPTSRQPQLDALRGAAALIVVMVHYLAAFYPYSVFGQQALYQQHARWENLAFIPPFGIFTAGHFAVCLFFILSGYVLSYSHLGQAGRVPRLLAAIIKRPIRLGGLVWLTMILSAIIWYFGHYYNVPTAALSSSQPWFRDFWVGPFQPQQWLSDMLFASFSHGNLYNPPLWTIKTELYGSIMVYGFLLLLGNMRYRMVLALLLVVLTKNSLYQGFWIGVLLADLVKHQRLLAGNSRSMTLIWLTLFLYFVCYPRYASDAFLQNNWLYKWLPSDKAYDGGYPMVAAVLAFVLVQSSKQIQAGLHAPLWQFFGRISYALYVLHFLIIGSVSSWMFLHLNRHMSYGMAFVWVLMSGLALAIVSAWWATRYVDEPVIALSHALEQKLLSAWQKIRPQALF
ncbi:MAG: hypothetical protein RL748_546 [Pseudomonadota bacterium]|jgi:peptidoglycan/LPS O-acetylase OafA/YrhL